jgi:hypothetical protein
MEREFAGVEILDKLIEVFPFLVERAYLGDIETPEYRDSPPGTDEDPWSVLDYGYFREDIERMYGLLTKASQGLYAYARARCGADSLPETTCPFCAYLERPDSRLYWAELDFDRNVFGASKWLLELQRQTGEGGGG